MKNVLYILAGFTFSCLATGCKPTLDAPTSNAAELNLSRYVAIGDYNTAGFMNGGLTRESQQTAYPNILAQQFNAAINGSGFEQPYFSGAGSQMVSLALDEAKIPVLSNTAELMNLLQAGCGSNNQNVFTDQFSNSAAQTATLQNLGVPGLKIRQIPLAGLGNDANKNQPNAAGGIAPFNPYFDRMLPAGANTTYRNLVTNSKPTFFTVWVGMADVLQFVMSGATCGTPPTYAQFNSEMTMLLDSLTANGAKGVVCNIPSVQYLGLPKSQTLVAQYQQKRKDPNLKIWIRTQKIYRGPQVFDTIEVTNADFITLKGLERLGIDEQVTVGGSTQTLAHGFSKFNPLTDEEVLDRQEAEYIESFISIGRNAANPSYNNVISTLVTGKTSPYKGKLALADMQDLYGSMRNGLNFNGVIYTLAPVTGGFYSYDYFSPTPRGQAIIANRIIQSMNQTFETRIFEVNVNNYPAFQHP